MKRDTFQAQQSTVSLDGAMSIRIMVPLVKPQLEAIQRGPSDIEHGVVLMLILKLHQEILPVIVGDKNVSQWKPQMNLNGSCHLGQRGGSAWPHHLDDDHEAAKPLKILLHVLRDCDGAEALIRPTGGMTNGVVLHASFGPWEGWHCCG